MGKKSGKNVKKKKANRRGKGNKKCSQSKWKVYTKFKKRFDELLSAYNKNSLGKSREKYSTTRMEQLDELENKIDVQRDGISNHEKKLLKQLKKQVVGLKAQILDDIQQKIGELSWDQLNKELKLIKQKIEESSINFEEIVESLNNLSSDIKRSLNILVVSENEDLISLQKSVETMRGRVLGFFKKNEDPMKALVDYFSKLFYTKFSTLLDKLLGDGDELNQEAFKSDEMLEMNNLFRLLGFWRESSTGKLYTEDFSVLIRDMSIKAFRHILFGKDYVSEKTRSKKDFEELKDIKMGFESIYQANIPQGERILGLYGNVVSLVLWGINQIHQTSIGANEFDRTEIKDEEPLSEGEFDLDRLEGKLLKFIVNQDFLGDGFLAVVHEYMHWFHRFLSLELDSSKKSDSKKFQRLALCFWNIKELIVGRLNQKIDNISDKKFPRKDPKDYKNEIEEIRQLSGQYKLLLFPKEKEYAKDFLDRIFMVVHVDGLMDMIPSMIKLTEFLESYEEEQVLLWGELRKKIQRSAMSNELINAFREKSQGLKKVLDLKKIADRHIGFFKNGYEDMLKNLKVLSDSVYKLDSDIMKNIEGFNSLVLDAERITQDFFKEEQDRTVSKNRDFYVKARGLVVKFIFFIKEAQAEKENFPEEIQKKFDVYQETRLKDLLKNSELMKKRCDDRLQLFNHSSEIVKEILERRKLIQKNTEMFQIEEDALENNSDDWDKTLTTVNMFNVLTEHRKFFEKKDRKIREIVAIINDSDLSQKVADLDKDISKFKKVLGQDLTGKIQKFCESLIKSLNVQDINTNQGADQLNKLIQSCVSKIESIEKHENLFQSVRDNELILPEDISSPLLKTLDTCKKRVQQQIEQINQQIKNQEKLEDLTKKFNDFSQAYTKEINELEGLSHKKLSFLSDQQETCKSLIKEYQNLSEVLKDHDGFKNLMRQSNSLLEEMEKTHQENHKAIKKHNEEVNKTLNTVRVFLSELNNAHTELLQSLEKHAKKLEVEPSGLAIKDNKPEEPGGHFSVQLREQTQKYFETTMNFLDELNKRLQNELFNKLKEQESVLNALKPYEETHLKNLEELKKEVKTKLKSMSPFSIQLMTIANEIKSLNKKWHEIQKCEKDYRTSFDEGFEFDKQIEYVKAILTYKNRLIEEFDIHANENESGDDLNAARSIYQTLKAKVSNNVIFILARELMLRRFIAQEAVESLNKYEGLEEKDQDFDTYSEEFGSYYAVLKMFIKAKQEDEDQLKIYQEIVEDLKTVRLRLANLKMERISSEVSEMIRLVQKDVETFRSVYNDSEQSSKDWGEWVGRMINLLETHQDFLDKQDRKSNEIDKAIGMDVSNLELSLNTLESNIDQLNEVFIQNLQLKIKEVREYTAASHNDVHIEDFEYVDLLYEADLEEIGTIERYEEFIRVFIAKDSYFTETVLEQLGFSQNPKELLGKLNTRRETLKNRLDLLKQRIESHKNKIPKSKSCGNLFSKHYLFGGDKSLKRARSDGNLNSSKVEDEDEIISHDGLITDYYKSINKGAEDERDAPKGLQIDSSLMNEFLILVGKMAYCKKTILSISKQYSSFLKGGVMLERKNTYLPQLYNLETHVKDCMREVDQLITNNSTISRDPGFKTLHKSYVSNRDGFFEILLGMKESVKNIYVNDISAIGEKIQKSEEIFKQDIDPKVLRIEGLQRRINIDQFVLGWMIKVEKEGDFKQELQDELKKLKGYDQELKERWEKQQDKISENYASKFYPQKEESNGMKPPVVRIVLKESAIPEQIKKACNTGL